MKQTNSFHSLQPKESVTETPPGVAETNGAESHHSKSPSKDAEQKSESKHLDPSRATTGLSVMKLCYCITFFFSTDVFINPNF